jgi:hypothetical protein
LYYEELFVFARGFVKRTPFGTRALLDKEIAEFAYSVTEAYRGYATKDTIFRLALWPRGGTGLKPIRYRGYSNGPLWSDCQREDAVLNEVRARLAQAGAVDRKVREEKDWQGREHLPLSFRERCRVVGLALLFLVLMLAPTIAGWSWLVSAGFPGIMEFFRGMLRHGWEGLGTGLQAGDRKQVSLGLLELASPLLIPLAFIFWHWLLLEFLVTVIDGLRGKRTTRAWILLRPLTSDLLEAPKDEDRDVREAAAMALGRTGPGANGAVPAHLAAWVVRPRRPGDAADERDPPPPGAAPLTLRGIDSPFGVQAEAPGAFTGASR